MKMDLNLSREAIFLDIQPKGPQKYWWCEMPILSIWLPDGIVLWDNKEKVAKCHLVETIIIKKNPTEEML